METRVFVAKCDSYEYASQAVERIFDAYGGVKAILGDKKRVLVKPNLIMPRKPEDAATTHPAIVEAVCSAFVKAGAKVEIIDSTGGPHTKLVLNLLYGRTGMKNAVKRSGASLSYNTASRSVSLPDGKVVDKMDILSPILDSDLVISVAKAKTHSFMTMTGCVKNMMGCIPGLKKPRLHGKFPNQEKFASMLVDVCAFINPGFSILDGVWGMEGAGPSGGDPKYLGAVIGGISPYAVDLAQCHLMGLRQDTVYTIIDAANRGLGPSDILKLNWLGDDYESLRSNFKPARSHKNDSVPKIKGNCPGCGDCVKICPVKCVEIYEKKAVINDKICIRCYCCHEFCPAKAILVE